MLQKIEIFFKKKIALVILSNSSRNKLWRIFNYFWLKFFNECHYKKIIIANSLKKKKYSFKILCSHKYKEINVNNWSSRIKDSIKNIKQKYLIIFMDDQILCNKPHIEFLTKTISYFIKKKIKYLRLSASPNENFYSRDGIYKIDNKCWHRISLQPAIWERKFFLKMLKRNENPREFEENSTIRSKNIHKIFSTNFDVFPYVEIITNGKLNPDGYFFLKKNNKKFINYLCKMNFSEIFIYYLKKYYIKILYLLPKFIRNIYFSRKFI